ncbi:hypothetical protein TGPRC2_243545 [Toxoplasma gondii TgCatPRC2]|uniref:Uncharacterized protein n=15 Tax=Toxoplasma gondii TaxID=5811 RepID=A0A125YSJ8_TOXGV|nr:hypothetical protein TGME49_243545 [Toxoplasma gondii ME49]EPR56572.1 hypothetical protein TGGT1_243545 [Toxoplasma gondii GT1]ESS31678.1 hypothetical protein TGVEG_243545 [Toxoplasma gondii VEG]KAF4643219.1 hypothetical protein TGRH88_028860 [Toxoplasma gondii]KFG33108.1 hypothetical protein TGDOM2_243545 [Toxoplasma gondii GAB2-2007-GAL-DOM2]KFG34304.1 hypothetical protein TGP89_243545 [Toxoplasma gondii p89]KFG51420.1 hypothetical protein TGFOU_243545 [Toxoplasma gondii FOU]KFG60247.1 |eukprot:XP_018637515.1 hypothetical protein TGME49_243545 [Toxoplasma gondii ME49]
MTLTSLGSFVLPRRNGANSLAGVRRSSAGNSDAACDNHRPAARSLRCNNSSLQRLHSRRAPPTQSNGCDATSSHSGNCSLSDDALPSTCLLPGVIIDAAVGTRRQVVAGSSV